MSYNVVQKIRNNYYLYEVTSEWDKDAKRSRQKRKYIGKCDENGNLLETETMDIVSKDLGEYSLLFHLARTSGLWKALCDVYGTDVAKVLFSYSCIRCTRCAPPTQSAFAVKNSTLPEYFDIPRDSRMLVLDGYLNLLRSIYSEREELFKAIPKSRSAMVFNSDVLRDPLHFYKLYGSKSRFNFNDFPHRTHFSAVDLENHHPFFFKLAKYYGIDRATLSDIATDLRSMGMEEITFNLRIIACNEQEVPRYLASGFDTILDLDSGSTFANEIMCQHQNNLEYDTLFVRGSMYRFLKLTHRFFVTECDMYIIQDTKAYEDRALTFYRQLDNIERTISSMKWNEDVMDRISDMLDGTMFMDLLDFTHGEDGRVHIEKNREVILRHESLFGKRLIITNSNLPLETILESSYYSNRYDQDLSIFRTDLQGGATLFPSNETAIASLMGDFISHHLKILLMERLDHNGLGKEMNYLDVLSILSSIKGYWVNGKCCTSRFTPEQKKIFEAFEMEPPQADMRYSQLQ